MPEIGDIVRIVRTADTVAGGWADRTGTCYGFTTPSVTGVEVVGDSEADAGLNVAFDDGTSSWFAPQLVTFVDVNAGQIASVGDKRLVRRPDGEWVEASE